MQLLFRFGYFQFENLTLALQDWQYILLVLASVCIAASGYVINDIFDQGTDAINKPNRVTVGKNISENQAYNLYIALTVTGVGIGFYLSNVILKPSFASIFIIIAATLYLYATSLKQMLLIGNFVVALLVSFSVIIIGVFDLYPVLGPDNKQQMGILFSILLDYAIFAFMINFIREIVKDIEDTDGDYSQGMSTLPIAIGKFRAAKTVSILSIVPLITILYYINNYLLDLIFVFIYLFVFVVAPLLLFIVKIYWAKTTKDFKNLSVLLKWILFFGILSSVIIQLNITYNA